MDHNVEPLTFKITQPEGLCAEPYGFSFGEWSVEMWDEDTAPFWVFRATHHRRQRDGWEEDFEFSGGGYNTYFAAAWAAYRKIQRLELREDVYNLEIIEMMDRAMKEEHEFAQAEHDRLHKEWPDFDC